MKIYLVLFALILSFSNTAAAGLNCKHGQLGELAVLSNSEQMLEFCPLFVLVAPYLDNSGESGHVYHLRKVHYKWTRGSKACAYVAADRLGVMNLHCDVL